MHTEAMRQKLFNIRFSDEEWSRLGLLTEHLGLNAANLVRMLLKEKARALGLEVSKERAAKVLPSAAAAASRSSSPAASSARAKRPRRRR